MQIPCRTILIILRRNLQPRLAQYRLNLVRSPTDTQHHQHRTSVPIEPNDLHIRSSVLHTLNLLPKRAKHILFTSGKIRMHLARQQRVLGDVRPPRVLVEREEEEPYHAYEDQEA